MLLKNRYTRTLFSVFLNYGKFTITKMVSAIRWVFLQIHLSRFTYKKHKKNIINPHNTADRQSLMMYSVRRQLVTLNIYFQLAQCVGAMCVYVCEKEKNVSKS